MPSWRSATADLEAVEVGHHHVEEDEIDALGRRSLESAASVCRRRHVEPVMAQSGFEHDAKVLFIVDEKDALT